MNYSFLVSVLNGMTDGDNQFQPLPASILDGNWRPNPLTKWGEQLGFKNLGYLEQPAGKRLLGTAVPENV